MAPAGAVIMDDDPLPMAIDQGEPEPVFGDAENAPIASTGPSADGFEGGISGCTAWQ